MKNPNWLFTIDAVFYGEEEDIEKTFEFDASDYADIGTLPQLKAIIYSEMPKEYSFDFYELNRLAAAMWYFNNGGDHE